MKLYHDENKAFYYIEKDGKWFEGLYEEESEWVAIPTVHDIEHAGLKRVSIHSIDLPEWMTDCSECDNHGWILESDGEIVQCDCYHATKPGSYDDYVDFLKYDAFDESDYQEWRNR